MDKIHNVLIILKQESFEFFYNDIKNNYGSIYNIEDFLSYFKHIIGGTLEFSLYADFLNYYFEKENEQ